MKRVLKYALNRPGPAVAKFAVESTQTMLIEFVVNEFVQGTISAHPYKNFALQLNKNMEKGTADDVSACMKKWQEKGLDPVVMQQISGKLKKFYY